MGMHARGRFAEDFEHRRIVLRRLDAGFPLEQHDMTWPSQGAMGDDLNKLPVDALDRPRRDDRAVVSQCHQPRQFGRDGVLGMVALAMHAQGPALRRGPILDAIGGILRKVNQ